MSGFLYGKVRNKMTDYQKIRNVIEEILKNGGGK
jgi:hypothetical protein